MLGAWADRYTQRLHDALNGVDQADVLDCVSILADLWHAKGQVLVIGNGGSASTASHLASDLIKRTGMASPASLRAHSLTDHFELISAYANDVDYSRIFAEQIQVHGSKGDVLLCFSCSGNSPNILAGIDEARRRGLRVVGFGGCDGGRMRNACDVYVHVPSDDYGIIESVHLFIAHALAELLVQSRASANE